MYRGSPSDSSGSNKEILNSPSNKDRSVIENEKSDDDALNDIMCRIQEGSFHGSDSLEEEKQEESKDSSQKGTEIKSIIKKNSMGEYNHKNNVNFQVSDISSSGVRDNYTGDDDEKNNMKNSSLQYKQIAYSGKSEGFLKIINHIKHTAFVIENYWIEKKFIQICWCIKKSIELTPSKDQSLMKIIDLWHKSYDNYSQTHKDILFTYYRFYFQGPNFINEPNVWKKLGFSCGFTDKKKNELNDQGIVLTLLHLLYVLTYKTMLATRLDTINSQTEEGKESNTRIIKPLMKIMENSIVNLRKSCLNSYISHNESLDEVEIFFDYHTGVVDFIVENFENTKVLEVNGLLGKTNRGFEKWIVRGQNCK